MAIERGINDSDKFDLDIEDRSKEIEITQDDKGNNIIVDKVTELYNNFASRGKDGRKV